MTNENECGPRAVAEKSARRRVPWGIAWLAAVAACASAAHAAPDPCQGTPNCLNLGTFTATALKVNVTRQNAPTAYQGVRTTVRFTNIGDKPLILGYRDRSSAVSDDSGLAYRWSSKAFGIGVVGRDSADPQFQLAPGESRDAAFEGVLQYSMRRQVAGSVFTHDLVVAELAIVGQRQVRTQRDHALSFSNLTASTARGAAVTGTADAAQAVNQVVDLIKGLRK